MGAHDQPSALRKLMAGQGAIAVAIGVMNVCTYGYTMIAARLLGPGSYGAFASLMATLLVLGVLQLGLQATAARRISSDPDHVAEIERGIMHVTYRSAWVLGVLVLLLTPVTSVVLRIDDIATLVLLAAVTVPMTIMGGQAGILQGERRWKALAAIYLAAGVPRLALGTLFVLWRPTELGALAGVAVAFVAPVAVGGWVLRRGGRKSAGTPVAHPRKVMGWETVRNSHALLAFFALSNVDVIVARNVLDQHEAGLYAGGLILTKAVLFLPQFVVVVAFPSLSTVHERMAALRRSLALVAALGAAATAGAALLTELALVFVGGSQYNEISSLLWLFAVLGTLLSMLQLLVYSILGRQGHRAVVLIWATLVVFILAGLTAHEAAAVLVRVVVADGLLVALLTGLALRRRRTPHSERQTAEDRAR